ncbi:1,25-dihydroxyvitamin D(3) 24-hydroxylase, mitochondrial-like [Hyperolius riggenbachi]|uniref:1,25-dihydroxyvitamin D(3) 24-hydroxylase, mitochondrial-like n=1 Tax=Hyperolius riggenbachi TaxID=752182 RepID=UPI0035A3C2CE
MDALRSQVEVLTTAVNDLTGVINTQQTQITQLSGTVQVLQTTIEAVRSPPVTDLLMPVPEKFSGHRSDFQNFRNRVLSYFELRPNLSGSENQRVIFIKTLLSGDSQTWAYGLYAEHEALSSVQQFFKAMAVIYDDPDVAITAERKLKTLRQGRNPVENYAAEFRRFSPAERNYNISNRELLAIKLSFEEWRHWLEGPEHTFTVYTDHKNLEYIEGAKRLSPRQARWSLFFSRFRFIITYTPGSKDVKADALSRCFEAETVQPATPETILPQRLVVAATEIWQDWALTLGPYQQDIPEGKPEGLVQLKYHQQFGGVFKMNLGSFKSVQIGDPVLLETFLRRESMYPKRMEIKPWRLYREHRGEAFGLLTLEGEEWYHMRRIVQTHLMKPKEISKMDVKINEVLQDFITYISQRCDQDGKFDNLYFELNKLSYEVICSVLYDERCGLLQETCTEEALTFIKSVKKMMEYLGPLIVTSADLHKQFNTKSWQNHTEAWDDIFSTAKGFIDKKLNPSPGWNNHLLNSICSNHVLTKKQLSGLFTELQIGGVETTANSMLWLIYNLSRNSDVQEKLLKEIQTVLPPAQSPTADHLQKMPYLKACIKESMRLTPTVPFTSRTLEEDTNLGGYLIPGGTTAMINFHAMTWNEDHFPDAREYKPERWLKPRSAMNPFASTPFGVGKRMCVGRRLAELQLQLTLCWIIQNFHICTTDDEPVKAVVSGLMIPTRPLPVALKKR